MNLGIAGDHAGVALKAALKEALTARGHKVQDYGTNSTESCDYPDFAHPLANSVVSGENELGILVCGSGNGVCITANKHAGIRAALSWKKEVAELARQHNNANVLCLPARFISEQEAIEMVEAFIATPFEGGRHQRRVEKIEEL